ncbi:MAG: NADH-quinone oxidoreductase subunit NuoB [Deltaproteobacteria bacterium]|nr:NADH-quinone oxidoreductase subunit NuoB [Deltaproteobacteria bacterium]
MLTAILNSLRTGVVTSAYPATPAKPPERFRGAPEVRPGAQVDLLPSPSVCPTGAIGGGSTAAYSIDLGRCVFCGRCAEGAPDRGVELGRQVELASRRRESLMLQVASDADGRATAATAPPAAGQVAGQIRRVLGRSLALRHLDSGSCNACDWELTALLNPVYDVRRLGVDFVASPRHADGLMVTGPVTRNLATAVRRTYEAVPEPRLVIAVGACACSGGIAGQSYASAGGVAEALPVDVFIPGCPPRPEAIIFGILLAVGRVDERRALFAAASPPVL